MASIDELFDLALQHHQAGSLAQAETLYRQVLAVNPRDLDALVSLGNLLKTQGRLPEALEQYRQALAIEPTHAGLHNNFGVTLKDMGRLAEAVESYRQAVRLDPNYADALDNLAALLREQGELDEAMTRCRQALQGNPGHAKAHNTLGLILSDFGRAEEAVAAYREAVRLTPNRPHVFNNLGIALCTLDQTNEAIANFRQALRIDSNYANAHVGLGTALKSKKLFDEAEKCYRQALALNPGHAEAHNSLGLLFAEKKRLEEAIASYRQALAADPRHAAALNNLGSALTEQGRPDEAIPCYREAVRLKPKNLDARHNLTMALTQVGLLAEARQQNSEVLRLDPKHIAALWQRSWLRLLDGDFAGGWVDYEQRWKLPGKPKARFPHPRWDGSSLGGKTILVFSEQGLGDTIHFIRYLPLVKARGGTVLFTCPPSLTKLCAGIAGVDQFVTADTAPAFDVQAPLLSLPGIWRTDLTNIPAPIPYLRAEPDLVEKWKKELEPYEGFKIGIAWQGSRLHMGDRYRSFPLSCFEPVGRIPGVTLVSLQKSAGSEQVREWRGAASIVDFSERLDNDGAFLDTAAVMMSLDLVITLDSAVAHLAGALGRPVWLPLALTPDWRWMLDRPDSPWYPTMRLFRQTRFQEWDDVFAGIAKAVAEQVKNQGRTE